MQISNESQILDQEIRKKILEGFENDTNTRRKYEAFKAYECLKDKTVNYVLDLLLKQFDLGTVVEMQYAMSNISILRKVIDKLAKVYANGCKRTMPAKEESPSIVKNIINKITGKSYQVKGVSPDTQSVEKTADVLDMNSVMQKANRYFRTFKNCLVYIRPIQVQNKFSIVVEPKAPFNYDVLENPANPADPIGFVLSDYSPKRRTLYAMGDAATAGRTGYVRESVLPVAHPAENGSDESADKREFIWWTKSYHFTTNFKGEIISGDGVNPILALPFVNLVGDQDGCFWAEGGEDLVDSGVKINTMISNINHVAIIQGYGQLFMTGSNLPKSIKTGPTHCIQIEVKDKDEPAPQIGFLNSNPPLSDLKSLVEMQVAFMLTTNNLSTSGVSLTLQGGRDFASGIAMMIDKSDSTEDISEQSKLFVKKEPKIWGIIQKWHEIYNSLGLLVEELAAIPLPKNVDQVQIAFPSSKPIMSEMDHLAVIEKRKGLGLNTQAELLMRDDPSLTEQEAQEKLQKIMEEKAQNAEAFGLPNGNEPEGDEGLDNESNQDNGNGGSNDNGNKPDNGPGITGKNKKQD